MTLEQQIETIVRRIAGEVAREIVRAEMTQAHGDTLVTYREACRILRVGETKLREWVAAGVLKPVPMPGDARMVRFWRRDLDKAVADAAPKTRSAAESAQVAARRLAGVRRG